MNRISRVWCVQEYAAKYSIPQYVRIEANRKGNRCVFVKITNFGRTDSAVADADLMCDPPRYILVRVLLTMCEKPRTDVVVYDCLTSTIQIECLTPCFRSYCCDPTIPFDAEAIESSYHEFIVHRNLLYDPKRGIRRASKVGRSNETYKIFQEIIKNGEKADDTHA